MIILITGTPGTGKTSFSRKLSEITGFKHIELNKEIKENMLYEEYDKEKDTLIMDKKKTAEFLNDYVKKYSGVKKKIYSYFKEIQEKQEIMLKENPVNEKNFYPIEKILNDLQGINIKEKGLIIDSHLSHLFFPEKIDFCIVIKTKLKELEKRLKKRNYTEEKIRENIDSEIFNVCFNEAVENGLKVVVLGN